MGPPTVHRPDVRLARRTLLRSVTKVEGSSDGPAAQREVPPLSPEPDEPDEPDAGDERAGAGDAGGPPWVESDDPVPVSRAAPLTGRERRLTAAIALAPVLVATVVLTPIALIADAGLGEVVVAAIVYGGLLGLAAGFVAVDRLQARQCPRCRRRRPQGAEVCTVCGYDLEHRPRFTCEVRHGVYLDPGACACGRPLRPMRPVRGIGPEVAFVLRIGAGLLVFLMAVGLVLQLIERNA